MNLEPLRDALLPCPFCGGEVEYVMPPCSDLAEYVRHKQPNHCPVEFTAFTLDGGREMIAAWNTRAPDPEITRQREVIEAWHDIDRKRDAEVERLKTALEPFVSGYSHTSVFLSSRQKMHPAGQDLYRDDVERAIAALKEKAATNQRRVDRIDGVLKGEWK